MSGIVARVEALEVVLLAEGASPPSTAIQVRVQHLEDICLGESSFGALIARVRVLEEACYGQASDGHASDGHAGGQAAAPPSAPARFTPPSATFQAEDGQFAADDEQAEQAIFQTEQAIFQTQNVTVRQRQPATLEWPAQTTRQAAHAVSSQGHDGRVFVGDLPTDVEQEELQIAFAAFGDVSDVHIMRGKSISGRSCAFVLMQGWEAGETAIKALSGACSLREGDPPMVVSWPRDQASAPRSKPSGGGGGSGAEGAGSVTKLFVGNLPTEVQPEALQSVFGTYGVVTCVHVMAGKSASGQSCAFVEYSTPKEAETAIHHLHEKYETLPGQGQIIVKHARNDPPRNGRRSSPY